MAAGYAGDGGQLSWSFSPSFVVMQSSGVLYPCLVSVLFPCPFLLEMKFVEDTSFPQYEHNGQMDKEPPYNAGDTCKHQVVIGQWPCAPLKQIQYLLIGQPLKLDMELPATHRDTAYYITLFVQMRSQPQVEHEQPVAHSPFPAKTYTCYVHCIRICQRVM